MAKITLIGMNNYTDGHIWDGLSVPSTMSKETFINTIMLQYGEMETLFSDADMMTFAITTWSNKNNWSMVKAAAAINVTYDPLNNYDRTETRTRTGSESGTNTGTVTDSGSTSVTSTTSGKNTNEHTVSAYDSSTYSADNKDEGSTSGSGTSSGTNSNTRTDNLAHAKQESESESIRAYGNIGVTTSQQMLEAELNVSLYNIYDTFAGIFAYDLLLMVY